MFNKHIFYCISGTILEWYDFSLFASLITILSKVFFVSSSGIFSIYLPFVYFASGFLMRPIGALFFGHLGDIWGRKATLMITLLLMAISTIGVGLLPTHSGSIWLWVLLLLRLLQGFAASGEYAGSTILLYESDTSLPKATLCSFGLFASAVGILLGSVVCTLTVQILNEEQLISWGWRIPFLLGLPLSILGYKLRNNLIESPSFSREKVAENLVKLPILTAFKHHYKTMVLIMCMYMLGNVAFYLNFVYLTSFTVTHHQLNYTTSFYLNCLITLIYALFIPLFAYLSDLFCGERIMKSACILMMIVTLPIFKLILTGTVEHQFLGQILLAALLGMFSGPLSLIAAESLPLNVRYSGFAVSLNFGAALFGGTTPLIATWLTQQTHNSISPAYYLMAITFVSLLALSFLPLSKLAKEQLS